MNMSIGLTFPGSLQDESIICYICKKYDVSLNIIEASFSMDAGWSILQIEGQEEEIKKVFEYLSEKNVKVQQIQTNKK
ncbi:MAG: NIL domain-containing protein [Candidatus Omnitrophica bacterium]|nr:NIL domain-containing protein [Candidatus Omnitrophota bacterium]